MLACLGFVMAGPAVAQTGYRPGHHAPNGQTGYSAVPNAANGRYVPQHFDRTGTYVPPHYGPRVAPGKRRGTFEAKPPNADTSGR